MTSKTLWVRRRMAGGFAFARQRCRLVANAGVSLLSPDGIRGGTIRAMARCGYLEIGYRDEITGRMPTPEEAETLEIETGVPVLVWVRTTCSEHRPLRLSETVFPADRNLIAYELGDVEAMGNKVKRL